MNEKLRAPHWTFEQAFGEAPPHAHARSSPPPPPLILFTPRQMARYFFQFADEIARSARRLGHPFARAFDAVAVAATLAACAPDVPRAIVLVLANPASPVTRDIKPVLRHHAGRCSVIAYETEPLVRLRAFDESAGGFEFENATYTCFHSGGVCKGRASALRSRYAWAGEAPTVCRRPLADALGMKLSPPSFPSSPSLRFGRIRGASRANLPSLAWRS